MSNYKKYLKDFDLSTTASVLDSTSDIDTIRQKMCDAIDRHIHRYVHNNIEYITTKKGEQQKKKVNRLSKNTTEANTVAIFLKYGDTQIPFDKEKHLFVATDKEEALWNVIKQDIKNGDFDAELTEASRKSSAKLLESRNKKK